MKAPRLITISVSSVVPPNPAVIRVAEHLGDELAFRPTDLRLTIERALMRSSARAGDEVAALSSEGGHHGGRFDSVGELVFEVLHPSDRAAGLIE